MIRLEKSIGTVIEFQHSLINLRNALFLFPCEFYQINSYNVFLGTRIDFTIAIKNQCSYRL